MSWDLDIYVIHRSQEEELQWYFSESDPDTPALESLGGYLSNGTFLPFPPDPRIKNFWDLRKEYVLNTYPELLT